MYFKTAQVCTLDDSHTPGACTTTGGYLSTGVSLGRRGNFLVNRYYGRWIGLARGMLPWQFTLDLCDYLYVQLLVITNS